MISKSAYAVNVADVPLTTLVPKKFLSGGNIGAKIAYGKECSMMIATRDPGYHSMPHRHDSEQLNYVLEGELIVFIDDDIVYARKGDIVRIPRMAIHWSWVRGDTPSTIIEMHVPSLVGDPGVLDTAVPLLTDAEKAEGFAYIASEYLPDFDPTPFEAKIDKNG